MGNPSHSYGASLAIWDHTVLPATRHKWTHPAITPAKQAGTRFNYPSRMEGWVDLGSLIAARPGIEPTTAWWQVQRPTVTPPSRIASIIREDLHWLPMLHESYYPAPGNGWYGDGVLFSSDFFLSFFLSLFIYFVSATYQHYEKTAEPICMKFSGKVSSDHGTTWLHFGSIWVNRSPERPPKSQNGDLDN